MEVSAKTKFARISPKKARLLLVPLKNLDVTTALNQLQYHKSKTSQIVCKLVKSALSNAKNNYNLKEDNLKIKSLTVDSGPSYKRYWFRSRGSADRLLKRSSHFNVVLAEIKPTIVKKPVVSGRTGKPPVPVNKPVKLEEVSKDKPVNDIDKDDKSTSPGGGASRNTAPKSKMSGFKNIFSRRTTNK